MNSIRKITLWTILAAAGVSVVLLIRKKMHHQEDKELPYTGGSNHTAAGPAPVQPVTGPITSRYGTARSGHTHSGVDVGVPSGTPVLAPWDGRVAKKWNDTQWGGGNSLLIKHDNGFTSGYCHLDSYLPNIQEGARVDAGDVVAYSGATGWSCRGAHLHFSLRRAGGTRVNPEDYGFHFQ